MAAFGHYAPVLVSYRGPDPPDSQGRLAQKCTIDARQGGHEDASGTADVEPDEAFAALSICGSIAQIYARLVAELFHQLFL